MAKVLKEQDIRFGWSLPRPVPITGGTESSGVFSLGFRYQKVPENPAPRADDDFSDDYGFNPGVAVGGDYTKPNAAEGTAAYSADGGGTWKAAERPPHGYRSAVAYSEALGAWIAVGTNGSDLSRDDGKTWAPLDDGNWNALSLPFAVGPQGRIGKAETKRLRDLGTE